MRRLIAVPVLLFAAAGLAACGSSSSSSGSSGGRGPYGGGSSKTSTSTDAAATTSGPTTPLGAKDFAFTPTALTLTRGGKVKVTNSGSVEHNFTVDGKSISEDVEAGESATVAVDLPAGTYQFHCKYHPTQMKGTITVG
jgi:plastocyanin